LGVIYQDTFQTTLKTLEMSEMFVV